VVLAAATAASTPAQTLPVGRRLPSARAVCEFAEDIELAAPRDAATRRA